MEKNKLVEFFSIRDVRLASTVIATTLLFYVFLSGSRNYLNEKQEALVFHWKYADSLRQNEVLFFVDSMKVPKSNTLYNQYLVIGHLKSHHLLIAKTLYMNYYAFLTTLTIFSVLLACSIFLLLKKGWDAESSIVLKSFFITNSVLATILVGYIQVYDLKSNIEKNLDKYFKFEKMQINIHSVLTSEEAIGIKNLPAQKGKNIFAIKAEFRQHKLDSMIFAVNQSIIENRGLLIDISSDKVPTVLQQAEKF